MVLVTNYDIITKNLYWRYTTDEEGWGEVCPTIGSKYYDCTFMSHHKGFYFYLNDRSNCSDKYRFDCMYHTCISLLIF